MRHCSKYTSLPSQNSVPSFPWPTLLHRPKASRNGTHKTMIPEASLKMILPIHRVRNRSVNLTSIFRNHPAPDLTSKAKWMFFTSLCRIKVNDELSRLFIPIHSKLIQ
ncbi:hypothetical protein TNIN_268801 [Trichonephila inaurata madagascariensis]|uniref:Uncharacterized protein n=1 Tax=Trichonephila inaurata madagascariensis TaxID=2747483 RepID=A0A8X6ITL0_9ARAC|nr:hypothetical protein TNIN_268801 [Trichonephila inaurata madagascariensis]